MPGPSSRKGKPGSGSLAALSPRARQALEFLYREGEAGVSEVLEACALIPSYSAARSVLRGLENKGFVRHVEKGLRYVYRPTVPKTREIGAALGHVLDTFFDGSPEKTMRALLDLSKSREIDVDFDELERLIEAAKREGR